MTQQAVPHRAAAQNAPQQARRSRSGFASGMTVFAALVAMLAGSFQVVAGLVALFNSDFYVVTRKWTFEFDVTAWGWIHLILGVVLMVAAVAVLRGTLWARVVLIAAACLTCLAQFAAMPYYPLWALTVIAACVVVIWALAAHGKDLAQQ